MEKKNRNGRKARKVMAAFLAASLAAGILGGCGQTAADTADAKEVKITNVSYDPTRELYQAYNALFAENGQGDVLIAWENEAFLLLEEHSGEYEIVVPSVSILCQPTVALVDEVVDDRGTRDVATEYLQYLYSTEAQKLEAENFYRPSDPDVLSDYISTSGERVITELPADGKWIVGDIALTDIAHFGGWSEASAKHFADGGVFDAIYEQ